MARTPADGLHADSTCCTSETGRRDPPLHASHECRTFVWFPHARPVLRHGTVPSSVVEGSVARHNPNMHPAPQPLSRAASTTSFQRSPGVGSRIADGTPPHEAHMARAHRWLLEYPCFHRSDPRQLCAYCPPLRSRRCGDDDASRPSCAMATAPVRGQVSLLGEANSRRSPSFACAAAPLSGRKKPRHAKTQCVRREREPTLNPPP